VEEEVGAMTIDLTVAISGIRPNNWQSVYDSIGRAVGPDKAWEMVCVGPTRSEGMHFGNFRFFEDDGSPCHCLQRACLHADGDWVFLGCADDSLFLPGSLAKLPWDADAIFCKHTQGTGDPNDPIWKTPPYSEVAPHMIGPVACNPRMLTDQFHTIGANDYTRVRGIPADWLAFGCGLVRRRNCLIAAGGLDTSLWETTASGLFDLGLRLQRMGQKCILWPHVVLAANYEVRPLGHYLDLAYEDEGKTYHRIYDDQACDKRGRIEINQDDYRPGAKWRRKS
jgi:hypothetical protein